MIRTMHVATAIALLGAVGCDSRPHAPTRQGPAASPGASASSTPNVSSLDLPNRPSDEEIAAFDTQLLVLLRGDKVNEPNPRVILDWSGKGNHGYATGTAGVVLEGRGGGSLQFNQDGSTVELNTAASQNALKSISDRQSFTIALWLAGGSSAAVPSKSAVFYAGNVMTENFWAGETVQARSINVHIPWEDGLVYFDIAGNGSGWARVAAPVHRAYWDRNTGERWTHWVFSLDPWTGVQKVYIDGVLASDFSSHNHLNPPALRDSRETPLVFPIVRFFLGGFAREPFGGRIDDFLVANNALSEKQVSLLYQDGPGAVFEIHEPGPYVPESYVQADLSVVDGMLFGFVAALEGAAISTWRIDRIFDEEHLFSSEGITGEGPVGSRDALAQIGDLRLSPGDADYVAKFQLRVVVDLSDSPDPVLGAEVTEDLEFEIRVP